VKVQEEMHGGAGRCSLVLVEFSIDLEDMVQ